MTVCGSSADWYAIARRNIRGARTAIRTLRILDRERSPRWEKRRLKWLSSVCAWLVLADEARERARELRRLETAGAAAQ